MSHSPNALPLSDPVPHELDQEAMDILGADCRGIGAFTMDALGVEKIFVNGVTAIAVAAATVAGGIKLAKELLGK